MSAVVAVLAVGAYDFLRRDEPSLPRVDVDGAPDLSVIEARIAALETEQRPLLAGSGVEPSSAAEVHELEQRVRALESASQTAPGPFEEEATKPGARFEWDQPGADGEPDAESIERFRKIRAAALHEERRKSLWLRVDGVLKTLDLALSERQKEQVVDALESFEPRQAELWRDAKSRASEAGGNVDWQAVIATTGEQVQREFAERISEFVPERDAEQISASLSRVGSK